MSKRSLRYSSEADMPPQMVRLLHASSVGKTTPGQVRRVVQCVPPHGSNIAAKVERRKYGNHITGVDGIRFDSKREAKYYQQLRLQESAGEVLYFLRQVPIHLPGGTKLVVDFQIFMADGRVRYVDVKGKETPVFRLKKREVEHAYPHLKIELA